MILLIVRTRDERRIYDCYETMCKYNWKKKYCRYDLKEGACYSCTVWMRTEEAWLSLLDRLEKNWT